MYYDPCPGSRGREGAAKPHEQERLLECEDHRLRSQLDRWQRVPHPAGECRRSMAHLVQFQSL